MMNQIIKTFGIIILISHVLWGCYPSEDLYYEDLDIAVSHYDTDYDFSKLSEKVCVVFDTVAHIVDEDDELPEGEYDDLIISEVVNNLKKTGFKEVYLVKDSTDIIAGSEPHMAVTISALQTDFYSYYYYPWYDYWYWGWGWGWYWKSGSLKSADAINWYYYPWYPWGGGYYYNYSTGTIFIDLVNAEGMENPAISTDDKIELPIIWSGIINGLISGSTSDESNRITNEIEQVFTQSPYLFN